METALKIAKSLLALIVVFYVVYFALNYEAIIKLLRQQRNPGDFINTQADQIAEQAKSIKKTGAPQTVQVGSNQTATTIPSQTSSNTQQSNLKAEIAAQFKNDWLYYPRLGIQAPVEWYVEGAGNANKMMAVNLVHIYGTSTPESSGETVITGHSSYYKWAKGDYKTIFAPLPQSMAEDNIIIKRNGTAYFYTVSSSEEIGGSAGYAAKIGPNDNKTLALMTCVPIGTSLKRLIIHANLVQQI